MKQLIYIILLVTLLFVAILYQNHEIVNLRAQAINTESQIDSLKAEIELRDEILNRCKDTVFGEEVVETNTQWK